VLSGKRLLKPSRNDYDWLGPGIYFWVDSPERGKNWAQRQAARRGGVVKDPYVIGAFIHPGLCLNLTDYGITSDLVEAYATLSESLEAAGTRMPRALSGVRDDRSLIDRSRGQELVGKGRRCCSESRAGSPASAEG
jgi:hypothetical protein